MALRLQTRFRHIMGPLIGLGVFVYFAYHTVEGDRGVLAYIRLKAQLQESEAQLSKLEGERQELERRVQLLRPDHLDPDMLEERARIMLNMGHDGDEVIMEGRPHP